MKITRCKHTSRLDDKISSKTHVINTGRKPPLFDHIPIESIRSKTLLLQRLEAYLDLTSGISDVSMGDFCLFKQFTWQFCRDVATCICVILLTYTTPHHHRIIPSTSLEYYHNINILNKKLTVFPSSCIEMFVFLRDPRIILVWFSFHLLHQFT